MNPLMLRDPDYFIARKHGGAVAAGALLSTAAVATTGIAVNKTAVETGKNFEGISCSLPVELTTVSSGKSVTVTMTLKHATASGGTYATLATESTLIGSTTTTTGTFRGVAKVSANLTAANKWVKCVASILGNASATGVDRTASAMQYEFFGPNLAPTT